MSNWADDTGDLPPPMSGGGGGSSAPAAAPADGGKPAYVPPHLRNRPAGDTGGGDFGRDDRRGGNDYGGSFGGGRRGGDDRGGDYGGGFGGGGQMASSANGAAKVADCLGNFTGTLKPKAWSVVTYNAGLHDCDTTERVHADAYRANLQAIFETMKPAASAVVYVTTTPYDMPLAKGEPPLPAGINMSCVLEYNTIAKEVAAEVGGVIIDDLYQYVEDFCQDFNKDPAGEPFAGNYTTCAVQTSGLHFFNVKPYPSGQQYTGISVAHAAVSNIPEHAINNATAADEVALPSLMAPLAGTCGNPPAPMATAVPNVLIIGDSISEPGSGYGPGVEAIFELPGVPFRNQSGALAQVQHNGAGGNNQAGPTPNGATCIGTWVGAGGWDVITINFGIHDCCPGGDGRPAGQDVPLPAYLANLGTIYDAASKALAPGGSIVWVTTTPHAYMGGYDDCGLTGSAFNDKIDAYNVAALNLMGSKPNVVVADLNAAVNTVCGKNYTHCNLQRYNNVHFTTAGKQFCALQVANTVAPLLAPKWAKLAPKLV